MPSFLQSWGLFRVCTPGGKKSLGHLRILPSTVVTPVLLGYAQGTSIALEKVWGREAERWMVFEVGYC